MIPLNSDLSFSEAKAHRVRRDTELDHTPYRIEVEVGSKGNLSTFRVIRKWNEHNLTPKSSDPNAPLEDRIDISPSEQFSETENRYVGQSEGNPIGWGLMVSPFCLVWMVGIWGWWPPVVEFLAGVIVVWVTRTAGDPSKIKDVKDAKDRMRQHAERQLQQVMQDVHMWAALDGPGFEQRVACIYRDKGFDVEFTPRTRDEGVDLILTKNGVVSIVQCKAYASNVGVSAVRELVGVRASWPHAEEAILVSLFGFSREAKRFAQQYNVKLFSVTIDFLGIDYKP